MKKKKILITLIMLVTLCTLNVTHAADGILGFLEYAENAQDTSFWYTSSDKLRIRNVTNNSIEIESPLIRSNTSPVTTYLFNVSADYRANGNPTDFWCIYDIDTYDGVVKNSDTFRIELDISNLRKDKIYYVYAIPIDTHLWNGTNWVCTASEAKNFITEGVVWKESSVNWEDPCFNINDGIHWEWLYCENHISWNSNDWNSNNWNNGIVYSINNVSSTCNNNGTVTATWQSWADVDIDIYQLNDDKWLFEKIWTVNSERKSFTFTPLERNHFSIRFEPVDWTQKINYDWHCLETATPEVKPVDKVEPVVVWPKENIMIILFGTLILYIVYRVATRKRS